MRSPERLTVSEQVELDTEVRVHVAETAYKRGWNDALKEALLLVQNEILGSSPEGMSMKGYATFLFKELER